MASLSIATPAAPRSSGSIPGLGESFAAEDFTGAATLTVPIPVPKARGTAPSLALGYRSGAGNGPYGMGFDVPLASISRQTSKRVPTYTADDVFMHSAFGELVHVPDACSTEHGYFVRRYRPRAEGAFPLLEWWDSGTGSFWREVDRDNVTSLFGTEPASRIADPADAAREFSWLVRETYDERGNHALYTYRPEDETGLPPVAPGRDVTANRYPSRIAYGNAKPIAASIVQSMAPADIAELEWHFEVVFEYGDDANAEWVARPDPFSSYHAGFEVRTARLCRSILVFHRFAELGDKPVLTREVRLRYDGSPFASTLARIEHVGFRMDPAHPDAAPAARALAPVELTFSRFEPGGEYGTLRLDGAHAPILSGDILEWIDLLGIGTPGLLHAGNGGVQFWAPDRFNPSTDAMSYTGPENVEPTPLGAGDRDAPEKYTLADALGMGRPQWLWTEPGRAAFAELGADGGSGPMRVFPSFPSDYAASGGELVSVTGSGLPDLLFVGATTVGYHAALGRDGYGPLEQAPATGLPPMAPDTPGEIRRFADVLGSGQQHYVRVRNGSVTCWPNLGYGRFGDPIELADAPWLGVEFDPRRVYLTDIDGSGAADLAYRLGDVVRVWRNRSGNGFAPPFEVRLPAGSDESARVSFVDLLGTGMNCLVVTRTRPAVEHFYLSGASKRKPYLLTGIDDNCGATTTIEYTTSAQEYLADRARGVQWLTVPPMPIHVVASLHEREAFSHCATTQTFSYRHGFYDPDEWAFSGFAFVERRSTPALDPIAGLASTAPPPRVVRTWFHNGGAPGGATLEPQLAGEFFAGDPAAYAMPPSSVALLQPGGEAEAEALWSLAGHVLRTETYGDDGSPWAPLPYEVGAHRYLTTQLQEAGDGTLAVFFTRALEEIHYDYERNAPDPRARHSFVVDVDAYGNVRQACHLAYARRPGHDGPPAQRDAIVIRRRAKFLDVTTPFRLLGVPSEVIEEQVTGLSIPAGGYLSFDELVRQLDEIGTTAPSAPTVTPTTWRRHLYRSADDGAPLAPQRLLVRTDEAELERAALQDAFAAVLSVAELSALLTDTGPAGGGFQVPCDTAGAAYWWRPSDTIAYADADGFYRPRSTTDPFSNVVTATDDPTCLFVASLTEPYGNITTALAIDYQALAYAQVRDPNGNIAETGFDPLGLPVVSTHHGTEGGTAVGFAPLTAYVPPSPASRPAEVLADPAAFVQGAASAFAYDALAWTGAVVRPAFAALGVDKDGLWDDLVTRGYITREGALCRAFRMAAAAAGFELAPQFAAVTDAVAAILAAVPSGAPLAALQLIATAYPDMAERPIEMQLAYFDGSHRLMQAKRWADEPGTAWVATDAVRYDVSGLELARFFPYSSDHAGFDALATVAAAATSSSFAFDAIGRPRRADLPLGTFRLTLHADVSDDGMQQPSAWVVTAYDENDTITESTYYEAVMADPHADPYIKQTLMRAALCAGSPARMVLDTLGRAVRLVRQDDGIIHADALETLGYDSAAAVALLAALTSGGYLDARGAPTPAFHGSEKGWQVTVPAPFEANAPAITALIAATQRHGTRLATEMTHDVAGNPTVVADARLAPAGYANLLQDWSLAAECYRSRSADAGPRWVLRNVAGNQVLARDGVGTTITTCYDALQRPVRVHVVAADGTGSDAVVALYGDDPAFAEPSTWNLRGRLVAQLDSSGLSLSPFLSVLERPLAQSRTLRADAAAAPDWSSAGTEALAELAASLGALPGPSSLASLTLPAAIQAPLETEPYVERTSYDATGRVASSTDADGNVLTQRVSLRGLVSGLTFTPKLPGAADVEAGPVRYDAQGHAVSMALTGTGSRTWTYDARTALLTAVAAADASGGVLQAVTYYRDPVGNVTYMLNAAAMPLSPPAAAYEYDLLYKLVQATGYEEGEIVGPYTERFGYDAGDSLVSAHHEGAAGTWDRSFPVAGDSNRLAGDSYSYDGNGHLIALTGHSTLAWTWARELASLATTPAEDGSYAREENVYDGIGTRVRKVTSRFALGVSEPVSVQDVVYAGALEIVTELGTSEFHAREVRCGGISVGRWIVWAQGRPDGAPESEMRFDLSDIVGSVTTEVDAAAQPLTHAAYLPYGAPAMTWSRTPEDEALQLRRYSGRELDAAGGLYHYDARPYSPALMRWVSPDPGGAVDGLNLYAFVRGNPVTFSDDDGRITIHHWNVKDASGTKLDDPTFRNQVGTFLYKAANLDKQGTVVFLTEILTNSTNAQMQAFVDAVRKKGGTGWTAKRIYVGKSEGGYRREAILVLTHNVTVQQYWQIVKPKLYSKESVLDNTLTLTHRTNDRFMVGVDIETKMTGGSETLRIGGYHNQGPSSGAVTRAGEWRGHARKHGVHAAIGDWNVEPSTEPPKKKTRRSDASEHTTFDSMPTSLGGSLYDYALQFKSDLGGRQLTVENTTGVKMSESDHNTSSATINTRKRKRD